VTPAAARKIALSLPEAVEGAHGGHPDFRVGGKVFASLWPTQRRAVVMVAPEEQQMLVAAEPDVFTPIAGFWGQRGATSVALAKADARTLESAMTMAWRRKAPKKLAAAKERSTV
jgi:hypothetical protein